MPGTKGRKGRRLTARRKFQIYVETRGENAPVGEILRRWNLSLEQLRKIERVLQEGAVRALTVRSGHRSRPHDLTARSVRASHKRVPHQGGGFGGDGRGVDAHKKRAPWGSTSKAPQSTSRSPHGR